MGWIKTKDAKGLSDETVIALIVRESSAKWVRHAVDVAEGDVVALERSYYLPKGFRFFEEMDWMAFAGASRFREGERPVMGEITVKAPDDNRPVEGVPVVISADERNGVGADVEVSLYEDNTKNPRRDFASLVEALELFQLLVESGVPVTLDRLARLGFAPT